MTAPHRAREPVVLARGFRIFFLLAGMHAVLFMLAWLGILAGIGAPWMPGDPVAVHAHGMLFGYVLAVVAGFLLTAGENWAGTSTARGPHLAGLAGLWGLTQAALLASPAIPWLAITLLEVGFLAALGAAIVPALVRAGDRNARFVAGVFSLLALGAALSWLARVTALPGGTGELVALYVYLVLVTVIGGRVIPFFTERALPGTSVAVRSQRDLVIAGTIAVTGVLHIFDAPPALAGTAALAAAAGAGARGLGWLRRGMLRQPLLWVLHAGNAWLAIGLLLLALSELGMAWRGPALHALTVGALGTLTLGMMARVTLGHTGRALHGGRWLSAAFVLVNLAAVVRSLGPMTMPGSYRGLVIGAGLLWVAAFAVFLLVQGPMLAGPRADGRPG